MGESLVCSVEIDLWNVFIDEQTLFIVNGNFWVEVAQEILVY